MPLHNVFAIRQGLDDSTARTYAYGMEIHITDEQIAAYREASKVLTAANEKLDTLIKLGSVELSILAAASDEYFAAIRNLSESIKGINPNTPSP